MELSVTNQIWQMTTWCLALCELILALYVLLLNARHPANRHVGILFSIYAASMFAMGALFGASNATEAAWPALVLAATIPVLASFLFPVTVVMLRPQWLARGWKPVKWLIYFLVFLPVPVTIIDGVWGTGIWYSGVDAAAYGSDIGVDALGKLQHLYGVG